MTNRTGILSLFGANAISQIGNTVTFVAVPWFILQTTGSAAKTGLAVAAFGLGLVVPAVLGGPINPLYVTVIQENTPADMRGRVFGALGAIAQAGIAAGAAIVGIAVEAVGLIPTIVVMGAVYVIVTLGMSLNPALHRMGAARPEPVDDMTPA